MYLFYKYCLQSNRAKCQSNRSRQFLWVPHFCGFKINTFSFENLTFKQRNAFVCLFVCLCVLSCSTCGVKLPPFQSSALRDHHTTKPWAHLYSPLKRSDNANESRVRTGCRRTSNKFYQFVSPQRTSCCTDINKAQPVSLFVPFLNLISLAFTKIHWSDRHFIKCK